MRTVTARITVSVELEDGQRREFDLDYGTLQLESIDDELIVEVFDNHGDILSSTEEGSAAFASSVGSWLDELGIRDDESEDDNDTPGYPRVCDDCHEDDKEDQDDI